MRVCFLPMSTDFDACVARTKQGISSSKKSTSSISKDMLKCLKSTKCFAFFKPRRQCSILPSFMRRGISMKRLESVVTAEILSVRCQFTSYTSHFNTAQTLHPAMSHELTFWSPTIVVVVTASTISSRTGNTEQNLSILHAILAKLRGATQLESVTAFVPTTAQDLDKHCYTTGSFFSAITTDKNGYLTPDTHNWQAAKQQRVTGGTRVCLTHLVLEARYNLEKECVLLTGGNLDTSHVTLTFGHDDFPPVVAVSPWQRRSADSRYCQSWCSLVLLKYLTTQPELSLLWT
ncbi:unnamed protein product [Mesocestoides corti]|uniref:Uncharacterized protein n=1 Tax=Mesocestoides corti TaxID=53468 RepID=A0A0R3UBW8_MESCO|nr:unnamed protein product [Mesocestoides corti]